MRNYGVLVDSALQGIPIDDGIGKEVTINIKTGYNNNKIFYTDSMGLESQKRVIDFRPTWDYKVFEPTSGNYYPINARIHIQDVNTKKWITVITDRSQGGTVMRQGEI